MNEAVQTPARARIAALLDANSFVEIGATVTSRTTDFNMDAKKVPSDGVITGYGLIHSRPVYVYSQDSTVLGGSLGEMHAKKILKMYALALKTGDPVIGLLDCSGLRIEEGLDSLHAFGKIFKIMSDASGVIPQITAVFGMCGGGMSLLPAFADFTFMDGEKGQLFVSSPNAILGNTIEKCDTSSADFRSQTGLADFVGTEEEILANMRELMDFLPSNNEDATGMLEPAEELNSIQGDLQQWVSDPYQILLRISDKGEVFEVRSAYAPDMVTAFIHLGGHAVGVVANRAAIYGDEGEVKEEFGTVLTEAGALKATRFVNMCDAFSIPIITLVNVESMASSMNDEQRLPERAGRLAFAFANATTAKISVLTGYAYGTPYIIMNSRALGADFIYSWKDAGVGAMKADMAAKVLSPSQDPAVLHQTAMLYRELRDGAESAAARGYVDTLIDPSETRKYLIGSLEMLYTKRENRPSKKHGSF
ncbi:MAG: carboxyl transferase [Eubacterium sp.]|nr:carboxyl transferase [Eubacterium sp.]